MRKPLVVTLTALSLLLCIAAGWCWKRSYAYADIFSRDSIGETSNKLSGVGSYRGALIIGSLDRPMFPPPLMEFKHRIYSVAEQKSKVQTAVAARRGALGFGVADGTIQLPVPMFGNFFKTPPLPYHIVFIPYYFLMLLTAFLPGWQAMAVLRRSRVLMGSPLPAAEPAGA
jgi:hypothetical protein